MKGLTVVTVFARVRQEKMKILLSILDGLATLLGLGNQWIGISGTCEMAISLSRPPSPESLVSLIPNGAFSPAGLALRWLVSGISARRSQDGHRED